MTHKSSKIGLIARADNRGLGQQTWAFYRNMQPHKTLVIDCPSHQPLPLHLERYPDAQIVHRLPNDDDLIEFLDGLTALYTAETGYNQQLWHLAQERRIKTVLHANYEFLDRRDHPTVWAAPSLWNIEQWPAGTVHLPVPIETDRLELRELPSTANHFLHIIGRPAIHDRNGTRDLLEALNYVESHITVTIRCQDPNYVPSLITAPIRNNVTLNIQGGDVENYWDNYQTGHALILPRRYGGLCLPAQEAIGAGMPVIMTDTNPNNTWLPADWLVKTQHTGQFPAKQTIQLHNADPYALALKIDQFAEDHQFYAEAKHEAKRLRESLSWDTLIDDYRTVLA